MQPIINPTTKINVEVEPFFASLTISSILSLASVSHWQEKAKSINEISTKKKIINVKKKIIV
jgi:hypothetical protein